MEDLARLINNWIYERARTRRDDPRHSEITDTIDALTKIYINHFKEKQ